MNLVEFQQKFGSETTCLEYLEKSRWGDERKCPHCNSIKTYKFSSGRLFKCGECKKQFTAKVGTIFSDSKISLFKWFLAVYLATSLKKGISSTQLSRYIGVTQKSAWFMLQRIRYALEKSGNGSLLSNIVEVDETYVGGNAKNRAYSKKSKEQMWQDKSVVFGMVERGGRAKVFHVKSSGSRELLPKISENIKQETQIYSDQWGSYKTLKRRGYLHKAVNHLETFKDGDAHTNTVENFWSHLKRGIDGVYHHVSPKHLQKYCSEYEYRYNTREMTDIERFADWFGNSLVRLKYKELINA